MRRERKRWGERVRYGREREKYRERYGEREKG